MPKINTISNWHLDQFEKRCRMNIVDFEAEGEVTMNRNGLRHIFKDRGADILAVAHLDTVQSQKRFSVDGMTVYSPQLDDRAGVFTIMDLLIDLDYDILLTEGEETGQSTAQFFRTDKKYKWMFEFDRTGYDCVMYQFDTPFLRRRLENVGIKPGNGSFSDIAYLGHLGCSGINMGVGYYNYHSLDSWLRLDHLLYQAGLFRQFYKENKNTYYHFRNACKTCGSTEGVGKSGLCEKHAWTPTRTQWSGYNENYYLERQYRRETAQEKTKEKWSNFDWDGKKQKAQINLLPPMTSRKSVQDEEEDYRWGI